MRDFFETTGGVVLCFCIGISIFIAVIAAAVTLGSGNTTEKMKACVASGQQWKTDNDGNYVCVR